MNLKKIMKIASDCGFRQSDSTMRVNCDLSQLKAFAKAILASEQEPVAWIVKTENIDGSANEWVTQDKKYKTSVCDFGEPIPLYLHPSQDKIDAERLATIEACARIAESYMVVPTLDCIAIANKIRGE